MTLTATTDGLSDQGSYAVTVATNAGTAVVTPPGLQQIEHTASTATVTFSVRNPGTGAGTYEFTCDASGVNELIGPTCWFDDDPNLNLKTFTIQGGDTRSIHVEFEPRAGFVGTGSLTLFAKLKATAAQSSGVATVELYDPSNPPVQDPPQILNPPATATINLPNSAVVSF